MMKRSGQRNICIPGMDFYLFSAFLCIVRESFSRHLVAVPIRLVFSQRGQINCSPEGGGWGEEEFGPMDFDGLPEIWKAYFRLTFIFYFSSIFFPPPLFSFVFL